MNRSLNCAKCGRTMRQGFVIDVGYGVYSASKWQDGAPVKSIWTGVKQDKMAQREIVTWRCEGCGYLENYAP